MIYPNVELREISLRWTHSKLRNIKTELFKRIYRLFYKSLAVKLFRGLSRRMT